MADSALTYSLKGRLTFSRSGWLILEVPNSIGNGLFQALNEHGIEQPISESLGRYNAHVSVIRPEEIEQIGGPDKIKARGQMIGFNIGQVREIANPAGWADVSKVWVANIQSPELMTLRRSLGLGDPKFPFHLTFAIRKKNALNSKQASLIHRTKIAATTTTIQPSPIHGHGLYAARDFSIGDTVVPRFMSKLKGADGRIKYDQSEQCRYTNHANPANCVLVPDGDYVHFVADRDIAKGEELTGDYDTCKPILGDDFDFTYRGRPYDGKSGEEEHGDAGDSKPAAVTHTILSILSTKQLEDRDAVHGGRDHAGDSETGDENSRQPDHRSRTDSDPDHSGFSKEGGSLRGPHHLEGELLGGVPGVATGGTGPGVDAGSSPERMGAGVAEYAASPIHTFGRTKSAASDVDERGSGSEGGLQLTVNRNQIDWGARLKNLHKRRGECPGCGQPFKEDEPYPDAEMCEVCETYGPNGKGFAMRTGTVPTKEAADSVTAYKQFRTMPSQPGSLFPLFINKSKPVPLSEWLEAQNIPTPGFAPRPGWHAGALPAAPHLRAKNDRIQPNRVWAEVELPNKVDWQSVANASPTGDLRDQVPTDGHYRKRTPQMQGGEWFIGGSMKVNRQLSDDDVSSILRNAGEHDAADKERHEALVKEGTDLAMQIAVARKETAEPKSPEQADAGNYAKGKFRMHGLHFSLENPKGSTRSGVDKNGKKWSSTMTADYGYIRGTLGKDGDHVDVFIGPDPETEMVFVVDQIDPDSGKFDEHKVMFGYGTLAAATEGYLSNYSKGWKGLGNITSLTMNQFKAWLDDGEQHKPVAGMQTKAANSIYLNALQQTPVTVNPEQGILGNLMSHLNTVKARGDQRITELGSQDRLLNAMDPNRATRQMLSFVHGTRQPIVNHPVDRFLAGELA